MRPVYNFKRSLLIALGVLAAWVGLCAVVRAQPIHGVPFTRTYPWDDIGYVPRGVDLTFDTYGRLTVVHDDIFTVLNDTVWLNRARNEHGAHITMTRVICGADGRMYYGSRGNWGLVEEGSDGRLHPRSLAPANPPDWTATAQFDNLVATDEGIYFGSWNGVVFVDFEHRTNHLYEARDTSRIFKVGKRVFIAGHSQSPRYIDWRGDRLISVEGTSLDQYVVELATPLDDSRVLLSLIDGPLTVFDGKQTTPWTMQPQGDLAGNITAMQRLVDGHVALAIDRKGVFVFSLQGELVSALTTPEYLRVSALANNEPGVLWVAAEDSIEKVFYGSPITAFGQRLGLSLGWPIVARREATTYVASNGQMFEAIPTRWGGPSMFRLMEHQPPKGAWALASVGSHILVGSGNGVYELGPVGEWILVTNVKGLAHLTASGPDLCYAIGKSEITALRWEQGEWREPAPRIGGLQFPSLVHATNHAVWVEMGADGVARVTLRKNQLSLERIGTNEWPAGVWVNVGVIGDTVVLSGLGDTRKFFDEVTETWVAQPKIQRLIDRSPNWIARLEQDEHGTLWGSHSSGVITFTPKGDDYEMDTAAFDFINDRFPIVHILPGNDIWISAARSLLHVEPGRQSVSSLHKAPALVSVIDSSSGQILPVVSGEPLQLPYRRNSLSFRFFSGGYASRRAPQYEFRLGDKEPWSPVDSGSLLSLRGLHEGAYSLQVRTTSLSGQVEPAAVFDFVVLPPWTRTWQAYMAYAAAIVLGMIGTVAWTGRLARKRNSALESLVRERTSELKLTMEKLNEETRNAATAAERNRLAGEIHDSLQQGLTGAMLQLDTTLKQPAVNGDVRTRLTVVRNMVAYIRQEVLHSIWDMQSPLLDGGDLGDALRKLTPLVNSSGALVEVTETGTPAALPRNVAHHLLRIAQEAISNAIRHADAKTIKVMLDYAPAAVSLTISDDGIGFFVDAVIKSKVGHLGLVGIRSRAKKLAGRVDIDSAPGQGTTIKVLVGLRTPAHVDARA